MIVVGGCLLFFFISPHEGSQVPIGAKPKSECGGHNGIATLYSKQLSMLGQSLKVCRNAWTGIGGRVAISSGNRDLSQTHHWHVFILRALDPNRRWSGQVAFPGGHVEEGETDEDAVRRECKEVGFDLNKTCRFRRDQAKGCTEKRWKLSGVLSRV